ncbi:tandem-95 repeat protein [Hoeflea olei]|uniref:Cadherin domain-containing protein n=1 Tax=Hoeflea olei TaxID=1480615 RepID=A0A1C1YSL6_9HYPH|nr:tandem-95 repeat protein [Hoeflea olei]OCW56502.1 hypothetical protein AWJ14_16255 [Hoeflea olei]
MTTDGGIYSSQTIALDERSDNAGEALVLAQAGSDVGVPEAPAAAETGAPAVVTLVPDQDNTVVLAADVSLEAIQLDGDDLILVQPDGSEIRIVGGAIDLPTFILGGIEVPQGVLVAALSTSGFNVAAGPDNTTVVTQPGTTGSGGDFESAGGASLTDGEPQALIGLLGDTSADSDAPAGGELLMDGGNIAARLTGGAVTGALVETVDNPGGVDADPVAATGRITFFDPDFGETRTADVTARSLVDQQLNGGGSLTAAQVQDLLDGFSLDTAGGVTVESTSPSGGAIDWTYALGNGAVDFLAAGETITLSFDVEIRDGLFASVQTVTITVTGTNDSPVVASADVTGGVTELVMPTGNLTDSGTISFSDVDLSDTHSINPTIVSSANALGTLTASVTQDTTGTGTGGEITWNYSVAASAVEYLGANDTKVETFTLTLEDGHGGTVERTVTVTIQGTNDAPVVSIVQPAAVLEAADAHAQDIAAVPGTITVTDADIGDTLTATVEGSPTLVWSGGTLSAQQVADLTAALATGRLSFGSAIVSNGGAQTIDYSWDPAAADLDFLAAGQTLTVRYDVTVSDATASAVAQPLSFTITGTNDAPVAVRDYGGNDAAFRMTEDDGFRIFDVRANDTLDPDSGASNSVTLVGGVSFSGLPGMTEANVEVTVTADNQIRVELKGSQWDQLVNGQTGFIQIGYRLHGDNGEFSTNQLMVRVSGVNDAPVLDPAADLSVTLSEDAGLPGVGGGTLVSELVDRGGSLDNVSDDGSFTGIAIIDQNNDHGTWYYSLNNGASWISFQTVSDTHALTLSSTARIAFVPDADYNGAVTDGLTIRAWDGNGGGNGGYWPIPATGGTTGYSTATDTVSLTVTAVNDAPTLSITQPAAVSEAVDAHAQDIAPVSGSLSVSDPDIGDTLTASVGAGPVLVWSGGALSAQQVADLTAALATGRLTLGNPVTATGGAQTIDYSWDPAAADLDFLAAGQTLTVRYGISVSDATTTSGLQPLAFTITGTNDAPVARLDSGSNDAAFRMSEDDSFRIFDVLANDTLDPDSGASNTVTVVGGVSFYFLPAGVTADNVLVTVTADNQIRVELLGDEWNQMANGQTGFIQINYRLHGNAGEFASSQLVVRVSGVNDAPVLDATASPSILVSEDAALPGIGGGTAVSDLVAREGEGGLDNVTDDNSFTGIAITGQNTANGTWYYTVDNGAHWFAITPVSDSHALTLGPDARLAFVPNADYSGTVDEALTFRAWDGNGGGNGGYWTISTTGGTTGYSTATDTVSLTVTAVNDDPVIISNGGGATAAINVAENTTAVTTVAASDVDGDTPQYAILETAGTDFAFFTIDATTGVLTFVAAPDYEAPADADLDNVYRIDVQVSDGNGGSDVQRINVTVTDVPEAPTAVTDSGSTDEDTAVTFSVADLTGNDTNPPGAQPLTITGVSGAVNGTVSLVAGVITFTPDAHFSGQASFNYTLSNGAGTDTGVVLVTVAPIADAPELGVFSDAIAPLDDSFRVQTGNGARSSVTALDNGRYLVTWEAPDGSDYGIFGRIYSADDVAEGPEFLVNTFTSSFQRFSAAAGLETGGFVVTWSSFGPDGNAYDIVAQRFDANGGKIGGEFLVNNLFTSGQQAWSSVAALESGGFVITWRATTGGSDPYEIQARVFDAGGNPAGNEFHVNTISAGYQDSPEVAALPGGGFVITWDSQLGDGDGYGIFGQRYDGSGTPVGPEFPVNTQTAGDQRSPDVAVLADGGFVVVWTTGDANQEVHGQRFDAAGNKVEAEFEVNTTTTGNQNNSTVIALSDGGFLVSWLSNGNSGASTGLYGQRYDANGDPVGSETRLGGAVTEVGSVETLSTGPSIAELSDGTIVVTWGLGAGGANGVSVQHFILGTSAEGAEDTAVAQPAVRATLVDIDGSETLSVSISAVPVGATLGDGTHSFTATLGVTEVDVTGWNLATLTLTPPANYHGTFDLTVTATATEGVGGDTATSTLTVPVSIAAVNDAPEITSNGGGDTAAIDVAENSTAVTTVTSGDIDGDTPQYAILQTAGTDFARFTIDPSTGVVSFVAAPNYEIPQDVDLDNRYEIDVQVSDGHGGTDVQHIVVTVTDVAEAPTAVTDSLTTDEDTALTFNVADLIANDTNPAGSQPLTITAVFGATHGTVQLSAGVITFTPDTDFSGQASFGYTLSNGEGTDTGTVNVTVTASNDAPGLTGLDNATFLENTVNAAPQIIDADVTLTDPDSANFAGGSVTVSGFVAGEDTIGLNSGNGFTVSGAQVSYNGQYIGNLAGGSGATPFSVSFNAFATPAVVEKLIENLTFANSSDNPTATRTLTISVSDGDGGTTDVTTEITVTPEADAPLAVAANDYINPVPENWYWNAENGHIYQYVSGNSTWFASKAAAAAAISGDSYLATVTSASENAFINGIAPARIHLGGSDEAQEGVWRWVTGPEAGQIFWNGGPAPSGSAEVDAYTNWSAENPGDATGLGTGEDYLATDKDKLWNDIDASNSAIQQSFGYVIEAGGLNTSAYAAITEDAPFTFSESWLLANDANAPAHILSVSNSAAGATVTYNAATGEITYDARTSASLQTMGVGESRPDTFTYTMSDGHGGTTTATVTVEVQGVYDAPVIANASFETPDTASYVYNPANAGWTFTGASGNGTGIEQTGGAFGAPTAAGQQAAFVQNAGFLQQQVNIEAGTYTLSLAAAARGAQPVGGVTGGNPVKVFLDGVEIGSFSPSSATQFNEHRIEFTVATSGAHVLRFEGQTPAVSGNDATTFLDAVTIYPHETLTRTISFESFSHPGQAYGNIGGVHEGLQWHNFRFNETDEDLSTRGTQRSGQNVAYNLNGGTASVEAVSGTMDLVGGWFSAQTNTSMNLVVRAYVDGTSEPVGTMTVALSLKQPVWVDFSDLPGFENVDRIEFQGVNNGGNGNTYFMMDDLVVNVACSSDPIVLDLNGDGLHFTDAAFDLDQDGVADRIGWPSGGDGLLVADLDGSGAIEHGNEVFSPGFNGGDFADSLDALASFDSNGDGRIDAGDLRFGDIKLWVDGNGDGLTDAGELLSLDEAGIAAIDLGAAARDYVTDGQHVFAQGDFVMVDGSTGSYFGLDLGPVVATDASGGAPAGGDAADTFVFDAAALSQAFDGGIGDLIADYGTGEGDLVDLSELLNAATLPADGGEGSTGEAFAAQNMDGIGDTVIFDHASDFTATGGLDVLKILVEDDGAAAMNPV